ncbi:hypothetical protein GJ744_000260 [Endocarpon pusillum]|uniref:Mannose-1-phosphate guanyltransferase n=1 Tax=Endocarpon pusillum TaxID=364733 RepID=A0A8H7AP47_9EURO|nr:hypothetical protein GJ744_000260 [Endocarpon pusillum]
MAPKPPKSSSSKGKSQGDEKEDVLQAVVIADTFETKFAPFTLERPRCLLPLANAPIVEYTLDFLAQSGVQEIFFSAGSHTDQVEKYIDESKWRLNTSPFKKFTFLKSAATSVGDVMRDLDQKGLVNGDFLAVSGDVISNFTIAEALAKHKARRQKDKNAIMTMLLREIGPRQRSRQRSIIPTFVMDPTKDRCLHYEESRPGQGSGLAFDPNLLSQAELEIRQDLVDCRIDICTPEMLSLWSDNFDNQSPRKDFLHGVLKDYELNGKTIHTHIVSDYFASRVGDLGAYATLSREITSRWTFPACPDVDAKYKLSRQGVYREDGVTLARSCRVKPCSIIGRGASIGDRSVVQDSVIGRHCQIGRNVHIRHAYIWDHAVVEDDVKILRAIIGDEAVIGKGCSIGEGALISFGVRLDQGRHIASGCRITKARSSNNGSTSSDKALVGEAGKGYCYVEEEDDEIKPVGLVYQREEFAASNSSFSSTDSQDSEVHSGHGGLRSESFATTGSDDDGTDRFHHEAVHSLFERMKIGTHQDDVRVELMGLRFAQNATEDQVRRSVVNALMKYISGQGEAENFEISVVVKQSIARYGNLIQRDQSQEATTAGVSFLLEAQKDLLHRKGGEQILLHLAKELYDQDIFDEEVFSDWWTDERSESTEELRGIKEFSRQFLDWLAAADEEGESASETEDEEVDEED